MVKRKWSLEIIGSLVALACMLSPAIVSHIGGIRTVLLVVGFGILFARYQESDCPFPVAVRHGLKSNEGMVLLLVWFYVGVIFSELRGEAVTLGECKVYACNILAVFYGLFLAENPKYTRIGVYLACVVLLVHALFANEYVLETGSDLRDALVDLSGMLGHTDYWTAFTMVTITLASYLAVEKNKVIKFVGFIVLFYLYKTILFCGFATPVALLLIGHGAMGLVSLQGKRKGFLNGMVRLIAAAVLIIGSATMVLKISALEDDSRFASIQLRFKNMIADPEGGGYEVENSRFSLAKISWETFKQSPLIGCGGSALNNPGVGGHQSFVDFLAIYGILWGGAFNIFVIICVVNAYRRCRKERDWQAFGAFGCVVVFLLVGIVNPGWGGGPMNILFLYAQPFKRSLFGQQRAQVSGFRPGLGVARPMPYAPIGQP